MENHKNKPVKKSLISKGVFPHQWAFTLLLPFRNLILSPKELIGRMKLEPGMQILEIGPGPGYFSIPVAKFVLDGKLTLADIQSEMLEKARKRIDKQNIRNVEYFLCDGEGFRFPENSFDRIFMVTVLGEVENRDKYFANFYSMLKKDGILSVSEQAGDPDRLSTEEITRLAEKHGFIVAELYGNKKNYTMNFKKTELHFDVKSRIC